MDKERMKNGSFIDKDYFEKYRIKQAELYKSDFDLLIEEIESEGENNGK